MSRSRVGWSFVLATALLVAGLAACEDLQLRSICGDGVVGFGEECDGTLPPAVTCEALGHYGGEVRCGADCRLDVTGCRRCGDGVLDVDRGEIYEVGPETCWRNGYLGGDHLTWDCRFFHPETCVQYRTVSKYPPVSRPILALDSRGRLWLSGLARGAFPGYTERPGCPDIHQYWEEYYSKGSWSRYVGYIIDPGCDQEFLAFYDHAGQLNFPIPLQESGTAGRVLPLTDGEVALIRRSDTRISFTVIDATGQRRHTMGLENAGLPDRWSVAPIPDGRLGIVTPGPGAMELSVVDPWFEVDSVTFRLGREFEFEGKLNQYFTFMPYLHVDLYGAALLVAWESPDTVSVVTGVQRLEGQGPNGLYWMRLQQEGDRARVTHLVPLEPPFDDFEPFKLHVDPVAGTFSVVWNLGSAFHLLRLSWTGETLADYRTTFRPGRLFEALDFQPDGGLVVAGTIREDNGPIPFNDSTCSEFGPGYFAERLDAQGVRVSETSFTAWGINPRTYLGDTEICDDVTRAYVFKGDRVIVSGSHMSDYAFCHRSEVLPTYEGDPFVICDIHLVQLIP